MRGLILQDILAMKKVSRTYGLVAILYVILGMMNKQMSQFGAFFIFFSVFLPMSAFAYREKNKWDLSAAVMPVSRRCMVKATYYMSFAVLAIGVIGVLGLNMIDILVQKMDGDSSKNMLQQTGILAFGGIVYMAIMLPVLFQYGLEKGRIIIMAVFFIPFAILMFVMKSGKDIGFIVIFVKEQASILAGMMFIAAILIVGVSYIISIHIYKKKEF